MRIVIDGHDLPGRRFDGPVVRAQVHVAVQVGREPVGVVRGDAATARWTVDVRTVVEGGVVDVRGPAVHGPKGERFVYLTWGDVHADGSFEMFRRAKLMVAGVDPDLLVATARHDGTLLASLGLTDPRGGPLSGRVLPPTITWRAG